MIRCEDCDRPLCKEDIYWHDTQQDLGDIPRCRECYENYIRHERLWAPRTTGDWLEQHKDRVYKRRWREQMIASGAFPRRMDPRNGRY